MYRKGSGVGGCDDIAVRMLHVITVFSSVFVCTFSLKKGGTGGFGISGVYVNCTCKVWSKCGQSLDVACGSRNVSFVLVQLNLMYRALRFRLRAFFVFYAAKACGGQHALLALLQATLA